MAGNTSFLDTHRSILQTEASQRTSFMPQVGGFNTTSNFFQSNQGVTSRAVENMSRMLKSRAIEAKIDDDIIKEHLPCSLEAFDHLGELYVEGESKLTSELRAAQRVPESQRRIISMDYLENQEENPDSAEREKSAEKCSARISAIQRKQTGVKINSKAA